MSPDGKRFATAGQDNVIKLWDLQTGKDVRTWDLKMPTVESPANAAPARNGPFMPQSVVHRPNGKQLW